MTCRTEGCKRAPRPGLAYCDDHALRWTPRESVEPKVSPWVKRALANQLPPKVAA